jgi:hypothetical protein
VLQTREAPAGRTRARLRPLAAPAWALAAVSVGIAGLSLLLPSAPTYDPWAWIIWGREITQLDLDTVYGPSWKPLPVVFTTAFAPFGDAAPLLWVLVARAGALLALLLAFRVAYRLAGGGFPGAVGGVAALLALGLTSGFVRNGLMANSEGLLVALVLWAVDRHLDGARRQALVLGFAAALLRPEVWPFLGAYGLWIWLRDRPARPLVAGLALLVPALWFLPELWGSGDPLRASSRARTPDLGTVAFAERPAFEVTQGALGLVPLFVFVGAGLALAVAGLRRSRENDVALALGLGAIGWVAIIALMTEAGYAGNPRYALLAAGLACVLAGIGVAVLVRLAGRWSRVAAGAAALVLVGGSLAFAGEELRGIDRGLEENRSQAALAEQLPGAIEAAGGRETLLACGKPYTGKYRVPLLAWHLGLHVREVTIRPELPAVLYYAHGSPPLASSRLPFTTLAQEGEWAIMAACKTPS